jgi:hypothetical protein
MRNCMARDPLDRLWQTCAWRRVPWTGAAVPEIRLLPRPGWHFQDAFLSCAESCGLKRLDTLPQVVIGIILEFIPRDDCFWRCVAAMHMAKSLPMVAEQPLQIVPLSWLVSWERGSRPRVASGEGVGELPPFIRFTIDRDGMSKFERMAERPQLNRRRFDDKAFLFERDDAFGASLALFRVGGELSSLESSSPACKLPSLTSSRMAFSYWHYSMILKNTSCRSGIRQHRLTPPTVVSNWRSPSLCAAATASIWPLLPALPSSFSGMGFLRYTVTLELDPVPWPPTNPREGKCGTWKTIVLGYMFHCRLETPS